MTTLMVTGHRQIVPSNHQGSPWPDQNYSVLKHHELLRRHIVNICYDAFKVGYTEFISGFALGADTLFAEAVLELKRLNYPARLIAAVPFKSQCSNWPQKSQNKYNDLLSKCDEVVIVSPGEYSPAKMQKRNEWMVDRAEMVFAIWNGGTGGTANCVKYAMSKGVPIVRFHPSTLAFY